MNANVPAMSIWLILAIIFWGLAAFHGGFYYSQPTPNTRWGFGFGLGWLGMFCYGLFLAFGHHV
jgi:hypothetical protein